jgi:hypothetical protein
LRQRVTWVVLVALAWFFVGGLARISVLVLQFLPFASDVFSEWLPPLSTVLAAALGGVAAFYLLRIIRSNTDAPEASWLGVAVVEILGLLPSLVGILLMVAGAAPSWLEYLVATTDSGPAPLIVQLQGLVAHNSVGIVSALYGAWRGARPTSPREEDVQEARA